MAATPESDSGPCAFSAHGLVPVSVTHSRSMTSRLLPAIRPAGPDGGVPKARAVFNGALGYTVELGLLPANPIGLVRWRAQSRRGRQPGYRRQSGAGPGDPDPGLPHQAGAGRVLRLPVLRAPRPEEAAALSLWLNASGTPAEVAARAGHSARVLHDVYVHCTDGQEDTVSQRIEDALIAGTGITHSSPRAKASGYPHRRHRPRPRCPLYVRAQGHLRCRSCGQPRTGTYRGRRAAKAAGRSTLARQRRRGAGG